MDGQPGGRLFTSFAPNATPLPTPTPKSSAVPAPTTGSAHTMGAATAAAHAPAIHGNNGFCTTSTYRSLVRTYCRIFRCDQTTPIPATPSITSWNMNALLDFTTK